MPASNVAAEKRSQPQILVETAGLSEEEWLAYRRKGIGGSDVAALLGISPWRTARDLYFDKLNIVAVEDNEDNWVALEMGHLLESLVAKIFQHRTGYKVYQIKKMFQHPQYSWMLADVDYIFDEPSANLDYAATKRLAEIMGKLKRDGYTIFVVEHRFYYLRDLIDRVFLIQNGKIEQEFTREQFCSLPEETRISYGLRTAYPERDAEHYQEKERRPMGKHLLRVQGLSFAYPKEQEVFRNVSFEAHAGDVIGILGHNGAGKTTLLSILTGLLKQRNGEITFDGRKLTPRQRRALSYLVMQDTDYQLFASSVEEELSLGIREDCKEKVDAALEALELSEYREQHPAALSGGQKQRVTIGAAIVKDSPVIYFDEPTSGLDYDSMVRVSRLIEQLSASGVIVFVVSHDFEFIVRTCTEVVQLDDQGAVQNHRLTPQMLKALSEQYFH